MEIKTVCTLNERELDAIKTIVCVDCAGVECTDCPLYLRKSNICMRSFLRRILDAYNISHAEGVE